MVKKLVWDSLFFKRNIGELKFPSKKISNLETILEKAKADGFKYIVCKLSPQQISLCGLLESSGFYLSDIGITWSIEIKRFLSGKRSLKTDLHVRAASDRDIPELQKISRSLFTHSRFYNDPFFTKKEADAFYRKWIENSVTGRAADIVLYIPDKGFVSCKKTRGKKGEIVLIGIKKEFRNKGVGTLLLGEALKWFNGQGVHSVSARTQIRNLDAMNFYSKSCFYLNSFDIVLARML